MAEPIASARLGGQRSGIASWLVQRLTSLYLAGFAFFIVVELARGGPADYTAWRAWWSGVSVRAAVGVFVIALLLHAWVGLRSVFLDYLKPVPLRLGASVAAALFLLLLALWGARLLLAP